MVATGGTLITRPTSPRFNWRSPSKISIPTFRFVTVLAIDFILDLFENVTGNILFHILSVEREHPDLTLPSAQKVNDPKASALAAPSDAPAHLANAARTRNNRTNLWISDDCLLELRIFVIAQILLHEAREQ